MSTSCEIAVWCIPQDTFETGPRLINAVSANRSEQHPIIIWGVGRSEWTAVIRYMYQDTSPSSGHRETCPNIFISFAGQMLQMNKHTKRQNSASTKNPFNKVTPLCDRLTGKYGNTGIGLCEIAIPRFTVAPSLVCDWLDRGGHRTAVAAICWWRLPEATGYGIGLRTGKKVRW